MATARSRVPGDHAEDHSCRPALTGITRTACCRDHADEEGGKGKYPCQRPGRTLTPVDPASDHALPRRSVHSVLRQLTLDF